MNLISIIIPTKNRNIFLNNAVKSVLKQTYTNWELLIINDYGKEIKLNYKDIRIKIINNKYTKGGNGARNTGIILSKGNVLLTAIEPAKWTLSILPSARSALSIASSAIFALVIALSLIDCVFIFVKAIMRSPALLLLLTILLKSIVSCNLSHNQLYKIKIPYSSKNNL